MSDLNIPSIERGRGLGGSLPLGGTVGPKGYKVVVPKVTPSKIRAQSYLEQLKEYHFVTAPGLNDILVEFGSCDLNNARNEGRITVLYPVLEKLLQEITLSEKEANILSIAEKFGDVDRAYYYSIERYNWEKNLFREGLKLGLKLDSFLDISKSDLEALIITNSSGLDFDFRDITFSNQIPSSILSSLSYDKALILPPEFETFSFDYNREYYAIQSFISNLDDTSEAESLSNFFNFTQKAKLTDVVRKLNQSNLYSRDVKAREFIAQLAMRKPLEIHDYLKVEGVSDRKTSENLDHAIARGFFSNENLYRLFLNKYGESTIRK